MVFSGEKDAVHKAKEQVQEILRNMTQWIDPHLVREVRGSAEFLRFMATYDVSSDVYAMYNTILNECTYLCFSCIWYNTYQGTCTTTYIK